MCSRRHLKVLRCRKLLKCPVMGVAGASYKNEAVKISVVKGHGQDGAQEGCKKAKVVKILAIRGVAGAAYNNVTVKMSAVRGRVLGGARECCKMEKVSKCPRSGG